MKKDYIDRAKLIAEYDRVHVDPAKYDRVHVGPAEDVVEVRHGYWKDNNNGTFTCSECGGKAPKMNWCGCCGAKMDGEKCWDREIPEEEVPYETIPLTKEERTSGILDSGARREFETGAVRDIQEGKGRCDLIPLDVIAQIMFDKVIEQIYEYQATGLTAPLFDALDNYIYTYNLNSNDVFLEVSKHFEEGAKKYGEYNWQKGIPTHCYINSAVRHYWKHLRGDKDEPHDRAFVWNILCCIWTCEHKPELNDYAKAEGAES